MHDVLDRLVGNARSLVASSYYRTKGREAEGVPLSRALRSAASFPVIAEVKLSSPSAGRITSQAPAALIDAYVRGGATALSVLTEPNHFGGSLGALDEAGRSGLPVLMKDIVVDSAQVEAGAARGAGAVLLIQRAFSRGLAGNRDDLISYAHGLGLEVVLEAGNADELREAQESEADILGLNQRDLGTMVVDPTMGERVLSDFAQDARPLVIMSGIRERGQVERLRDLGASAVLVGTSLSSSPDPASALATLVVPR